MCWVCSRVLETARVLLSLSSHMCALLTSRHKQPQTHMQTATRKGAAVVPMVQALGFTDEREWRAYVAAIASNTPCEPPPPPSDLCILVMDALRASAHDDAIERYHSTLNASDAATKQRAGVSTSFNGSVMARTACPRCRGILVESSCAQTRGADEGMTVFHQCLAPQCRHRWRGNN